MHHNLPILPLTGCWYWKLLSYSLEYSIWNWSGKGGFYWTDAGAAHNPWAGSWKHKWSLAGPQKQPRSIYPSSDSFFLVLELSLDPTPLPLLYWPLGKQTLNSELTLWFSVRRMIHHFHPRSSGSLRVWGVGWRNRNAWPEMLKQDWGMRRTQQGWQQGCESEPGGEAGMRSDEDGGWASSSVNIWGGLERDKGMAGGAGRVSWVTAHSQLSFGVYCSWWIIEYILFLWLFNEWYVFVKPHSKGTKISTEKLISFPPQKLSHTIPWVRKLRHKQAGCSRSLSQCM